MSERISNLEAAQRQLLTAIQLFFAEQDSISVHTLASAAREIIEQHCSRNKIQSFTWLVNSSNPQLDGNAAAVFNYYRNFFKHHRAGEEEWLDDFTDELNDFQIFSACYSLTQLLPRCPMEVDAFMIWFVAKHPALAHTEVGQHVTAATEDMLLLSREKQKKVGRNILEWAAQQNMPEYAEMMKVAIAQNTQSP